VNRVYLCGPINGRGDECVAWREQVKAALPERCLDPMRRDYRGRELDAGVAAEIVEQDLADIHECDTLLVYFDRPSVGTSMEVFYGYRLGKRVIVVDRSNAPISPWLVHHSHAIVRDLASALALLP